MANRLPSLRALRVLEAVWKEGSIAAAAQHLNVSQSAVGHQLRQIEVLSGVRLLQREGRRIHLTEAGESLAVVAHRGFSAIRHEVDRLTMRERLPITLAAMPMVMTNWILPNLADFQRRYPDVALHMSTIQSDQVVTPEPEVAILFSLSGDLPPNARPLIHGRAVPVCAPSYLAEHPVRSDADILRGKLLHDEDSRMWRAWAQHAGLPPTEARDMIYLAGSNMLFDAAILGQGIALCREALIARSLAAGHLQVVSDVRIDQTACYYTIVSNDGRRRGGVSAVLRWLTGLARSGNIAPSPLRSSDGHKLTMSELHQPRKQE